MQVNVPLAAEIPARNAADNNGMLNGVQNIALVRAQARAEDIADDPVRVDEVIVNARARQDRLRAVAGNFLMGDFFDMIDMLNHARASIFSFGQAPSC